jgi:N-acetylglucosamine-6-phosphate deacetylase
VTTVLRGTVVTPDGIIDDGDVAFDGQRITTVGRASTTAPTEELPEDVLLLPGLVDIHCHGGGGGEFGADEDSARHAAAHHHRSGTTSVVASLVSAPHEVLMEGMRTCAALATEGLVAGVHTEGPFLSPARCGAQDPKALTAVDLNLVEALSSVAGGHWRMMTFAPELSGSVALVERLASLGVRPAVGHTNATAAETAGALSRIRTETGAPAVVSHLFNGMPPFHHRSPGPAAAALTAAARGDAVVELVADGVHLAEETAAMVLTAAGPDSTVLVTDAMAASGMPDGEYKLGGLSVVVSHGAARLSDGGALAGGVATLLDVVRRCVRSGGISIPRAVRAASWAPARALGLSDSVGALLPGRYADIVAVDGNLRPVAVWRRGRRLTD